MKTLRDMKNNLFNPSKAVRLFSPGLMVVVSAVVPASCSYETLQTPVSADEPIELVFSVEPDTRGITNYPLSEYFREDYGMLYVDVTVGSLSAVYKYSDGELRYYSGDKLAFTDATQPLPSVELSWPAGYEYKSDQRDFKDFLASDHLVCRLTDLMPSGKIPVQFDHANYKITFYCNTDISDYKKLYSLVVYYDAKCDNAGWYCFVMEEKLEAQLLLPLDTMICKLYFVTNLDGDMSFSPVPDYESPPAGALNYHITLLSIHY